MPADGRTQDTDEGSRGEASWEKARANFCGYFSCCHLGNPNTAPITLMNSLARLLRGRGLGLLSIFRTTESPFSPKDYLLARQGRNPTVLGSLVQRTRVRDSHRAWRILRLRHGRPVASRTRTSAKIQEQRKRLEKEVSRTTRRDSRRSSTEPNVESSFSIPRPIVKAMIFRT
jgi:hypothetical protein